MHGIPASMAPKEQLDIQFIIWKFHNTKNIKQKQEYSQHNIFHSMLDFLAVESTIYDEDMSIFE